MYRDSARDLAELTTGKARPRLHKVTSCLIIKFFFLFRQSWRSDAIVRSVIVLFCRTFCLSAG